MFHISPNALAQYNGNINTKGEIVHLLHTLPCYHKHYQLANIIHLKVFCTDGRQLIFTSRNLTPILSCQMDPEVGWTHMD